MSAQNTNKKFSDEPSPEAGKGIRLAYGQDRQQFGELYVPDGTGPHPVVVLIHGGFWRAPYGLALMTGLADDLAARGIAAWNIEYRRVGDPGGGWPGTLQDVASAFDALQTLAPTYSLDLRKVVPVGHSAGGQLALWLATRPMLTNEKLFAVPSSLIPTGIVSLAGAMDMKLVWHLKLGSNAAEDFLGGGPSDVPERYTIADPTIRLPLGVPQVLIHGTRDDRVPLEVSQSYHAKALSAHDTITLIELSGADHFVLIDATSTAWGTTIEEINKLLPLL